MINNNSLWFERLILIFQRLFTICQFSKTWKNVLRFQRLSRTVRARGNHNLTLTGNWTQVKSLRGGSKLVSQRLIKISNIEDSEADDPRISWKCTVPSWYLHGESLVRSIHISAIFYEIIFSSRSDFIQQHNSIFRTVRGRLSFQCLVSFFSPLQFFFLCLLLGLKKYIY